MVVMVGFVGRRRRVVRVCAVVSGAAARGVGVTGAAPEVMPDRSISRFVGQSYRVVGTAFRVPKEMCKPGSVLCEIGDRMAGAEMVAETPCGTVLIVRGAGFVAPRGIRKAQLHLRC